MNMHSCVGCRQPLTPEEEIKLLNSCGIAICDSCAGMIVVSYENWHSGPREIKPGESQKKRYISDAIRLRIFKRDGYQCKRCGINKNLTIDHIYPISLGGTSEDKNLQTLCMSCNSSKGANV